jgi:hypothetical protein
MINGYHGGLVYLYFLQKFIMQTLTSIDDIFIDMAIKLQGTGCELSMEEAYDPEFDDIKLFRVDASWDENFKLYITCSMIKK